MKLQLRSLSAWLALCLTCSWPGVAHSQAFVEHLSPPVLQRGTVSRLELLGTETNEAVGLWSSLPKVELRVRSVG